MKGSIRYYLIFLFLMGAVCPAWGAGVPRSQRKIPDTVTLATMNANYKDALEEIARRYEEENPGIEVEILIIAQDFQTWIRSRFAAGGDLVPDIYNVNYTTGFEREGKILFLDEYLEETNPYTGTPWKECIDYDFETRYAYANQIFVIHLDFIEIAIFYNKDIFEEVGVSIPETWDEFLAMCAKIQDAGYFPVAMPGNYDALWAGELGWMVRTFGDVYLRDLVPLVMSRPGDWDYDPGRNADYVYDPDDIFCDYTVSFNTERLIGSVVNGDIDITGPRFQATYRRIKEFSQYWQPGYLGNDSGSALQLFYRQRAAMYFLTSAFVTAIERDFRKLDPEDRFRYGTFWFPTITDDPLAQGPFRGTGGGGVGFGITKKSDPAHERNVVDFFMYLTTPESGQLLVDKTLEADQPLIGPMLIQGVELPPGLEEKFEPFMGHGFEKLNFRGLEDEQESVAEWVAACQEYLGGRYTLDEFLAEYERAMLAAVPKLKERYGYDLDPTTKDVPPTPGHLAAADSGWQWNPFKNGLLAVLLILLFFGGFGCFHIARSAGAARQRAITAYTLLLPTFFLLGTFSYYPAFSGLYHAFTEWEEGQDAVFNGLANVRELLHDKAFWQGLGNMTALIVAGVFKATLVPFLAAEMILALAGKRLRYLFRTGFLLPMVAPGMVTILIWRFVYDPNVGMLNEALRALGLGWLASNWLGEPHLALPSIIFLGFPWIGALGLLIYLAGLMNVPSSVYEAYKLESESFWRRLIAIDMPLVRGQTRLLVILTFIGSLQDFQAILIMTGGGPGYATTVPALRMYYEAFRFGHFGYGAMLGLVLFLAIMLITFINLKVLKPAEEL